MKAFDKKDVQTLCAELSDEIKTGNIPEEYKHLTVRFIDINCKFGYAKFGEFTFNRDRFVLITRDARYKNQHNAYFNKDCIGYKIRTSPEYYFVEAMFAGVFTERVDCNGKPIFTGDFVRADDYTVSGYAREFGSSIASGVCAMKYFDKYVLLLDNHCLFLDDANRLEVMGNVFFDISMLDHEFDIRQNFNIMSPRTKEFFEKIAKAPYFKGDSWQEAVAEIFTDEKIPFVTCDRVTPSRITELQENEVFVFGSNIEGNHFGGAARFAYDNFGAQWTKGVGHYGESYAIPTMDGSVDYIEPYVNDFLNYAKNYPEYRFLVTEIGCGIAGYKVADIAPLFYRALEIDNICLPRSFWEELNVEAEQNRKVISHLDSTVANQTVIKEPIFDICCFNTERTARFSLGKKGANPLIVLGVNPSKADAYNSDPTIRKVQGFAKRNGFDGFIMINICPYIETIPGKLPQGEDTDLMSKNIQHIRKIVQSVKKPTILVAFGDTIKTRPYLRAWFYEISRYFPENVVLKQIGSLTKSGNPRHPSRCAYLDLEDYRLEF